MVTIIIALCDTDTWILLQATIRSPHNQLHRLDREKDETSGAFPGRQHRNRTSKPRIPIREPRRKWRAQPLPLSSPKFLMWAMLSPTWTLTVCLPTRNVKVLIGSLCSTRGSHVSLMWILFTTSRMRVLFAVSDSAKMGGMSRLDAIDQPRFSTSNPASKYRTFRMIQSTKTGISTSGVSVSVPMENTSPQEQRTSRSGCVKPCIWSIAYCTQFCCANLFICRSGKSQHVLLGTLSPAMNKTSIPLISPAMVNTLPPVAAIVRSAFGILRLDERY